MNLAIFAYHVHEIAIQLGKLNLSPCAGLRMEIEIKPATGEFEGQTIWDSVYIDGICRGNRCGGIRVFTEKVEEYMKANGLTLI